jgi:hypothetical protein
MAFVGIAEKVKVWRRVRTHPIVAFVGNKQVYGLFPRAITRMGILPTPEPKRLPRYRSMPMQCFLPKLMYAVCLALPAML